MKFAVQVAIVVSTLLTSCDDRPPSPAVIEPLAPASISSPSKSISGIELGMPLVVPPCKSKSSWEVSETCWRHYEYLNKSASGQPPPDDSLKIVFSDEQLPTGVLSVATATLINGKVESIELDTLGSAFQESIYRMLVEKWGQPQVGEIEDLQNGFGATFQSINSQWEFSDFSVVFLGMTTIDTGHIQIRTNIYNQLVAKNKAGLSKSL